MKHVWTTMALLTVIVIAFAFMSPVEARDKQYTALQINNFVVDGNIDEWGIEDPVIIPDQLKDTGAQLPDPDDFSGEIIVGWNSQDAERVYLVYIVTDDEIQDINAPAGNWWDDDSAEIIFDFDNTGTREKFVVGATGELSDLANADNTEFVIKSDEAKNLYIYEIAITRPQGFKVAPDVVIGLSPIYNDCENGVREHQLGWIGGGANNSANMGDIIFSAKVRRPLAVEPADKLTTTWGALKH
ncbi:sugar-binding protein [Candidatus Poribacteria bacterium]